MHEIFDKILTYFWRLPFGAFTTPCLFCAANITHADFLPATGGATVTFQIEHESTTFLYNFVITVLLIKTNFAYILVSKSL